MCNTTAIFCIVVFALVHFISCQYPYICEEPSVLIETNTTAFEFLDCTPTMYLYKKDDNGNILPEKYRWEFIHPVERNENGEEVPLPIPTPDLPNTNGTVYTFWYREIDPFIYEGKEIGKIVTLTTPTTYIVKYHIVDEPYDYTLNGETFTVKAGGFKVEFYVNDWVFRNESNILEFPLSISSSTGMKRCNIYPHTELQSKFFCEGRIFDFLEYAQLFVTINDFSIHKMVYHNIQSFYDDDDIQEESWFSEYEDKCDENKNKFVRESIFIGTVDAYDGTLFYDPDVSLLLGGTGNNNNCSDSEIDFVILWLSVSFCGFAIIISILFVIIVLYFPPARKWVQGKESTRIWHVRESRRDFNRNSDSFSVTVPDL